MKKLLVATFFLCALSLLSGCTSGARQPAETSGQGKNAAASDARPGDASQLSSHSEIAAGTWSAAKFAKNHSEHLNDQRPWQSLQRFGLTLHYPPDWQLNPRVPSSGPIALNTFESHYSQRGGHFPSHGAEIDISNVARPKGSAQQIMTEDLKEADDRKIDEVPFNVGGLKGLRASYVDNFPGYLAHQTLVVYVQHGTGLYKFFLTYHKGDALGPEFISDFEGILKSVRFT